MAVVRRHKGEDTASMARRFRNMCQHDGTLQDLKIRPAKPGERRRQKARAAWKRKTQAERRQGGRSE